VKEFVEEMLKWMIVEYVEEIIQHALHVWMN